MDQSLGQKIDKNRCGPQFGPDQKVQRGGYLEGLKRGRNALHIDRPIIMAKDTKSLKMIICNFDLKNC